jgi:hypothetical protein
MRCPNCSYISFDYLDQCVKCRADLTGERERLRLPGKKPNPISFQDIMERMPIISQQQRRSEMEEATIKTQGPVVPKKPDIDLSQGLSLDISIPSEDKTVARNPKNIFQSGGPELTLEGFELNGSPEKKGD